MLTLSRSSLRYTSPYPIEAALVVCGPGRAEHIRLIYGAVGEADGTVWGCELKYGFIILRVDFPGGRENPVWQELERLSDAAETTCEQCTAAALLRDDREYWRVLCDEHAT